MSATRFVAGICYHFLKEVLLILRIYSILFRYIFLYILKWTLITCFIPFLITRTLVFFHVFYNNTGSNRFILYYPLLFGGAFTVFLSNCVKFNVYYCLHLTCIVKNNT